ncbi:diguanylate cyclase [Psychromonas ingrahamii 37]|uniref:diguanylate cyclase n=1 Tax=Psychromonas ingrahamii (strain DSM 17664 / CCUG 51855 / 37) TaxID=357804 RepID=A1SVZ1_PSYIN|nr:sensor domain-containing diguanylate cyclase [Psychromonas ingrahamii]ABM03656.1 diguanylate cyclase [Psychromonas ingrahamii 37]
MKSKYHIVITVTFLLVTLSVILSTVNYWVSLNSTEVQLRERSLPLTVDNISMEIQKKIIGPHIISSMMANDTFLQDWLINNEGDVDKISKYLEMIKNKNKLLVTFLVSGKTKNYYTAEGLLEQVVEDNPNNAWYFSFMEKPDKNEINFDFNDNIDNEMIIFINHKIYDQQSHLIGATGIGLKFSDVNEMLNNFRQKYNFNVYFLNQAGKVILYEKGVNPLRDIKNISELNVLRDSIISKESKLLEYTKESEEYLMSTKYIPELDLYLVVEAKRSEFLLNVQKTFYFNLLCSLLGTILIAFLILKTVNKYYKEMEHLAKYDALTNLKNRRAFNEELEHSLLLCKRRASHLSLTFFDLDDFKSVNDTFGHQTGDKVLQYVADILKDDIRQTDIIGRWGGEEFIVAFIDTELEDAKFITEKIRAHIEKDSFLSQLKNMKVTASFGLTTITTQDTLDSLLERADQALYKAKENGKNQVFCL